MLGAVALGGGSEVGGFAGGVSAVELPLPLPPQAANDIATSGPASLFTHFLFIIV
jgi:hypothetical protein